MPSRQAAPAAAAGAWELWDAELDEWCRVGPGESTRPIVGHGGLLVWEMAFDDECGIDNSGNNQQDWETEFDRECGDDFEGEGLASTVEDRDENDKNDNKNGPNCSSGRGNTTTTQDTMQKLEPDTAKQTSCDSTAASNVHLNSPLPMVLSGQPATTHGNINDSAGALQQRTRATIAPLQSSRTIASLPLFAPHEEDNNVPGMKKLEPISLIFLLADQLEHLNERMEARSAKGERKASGLSEQNIMALEKRIHQQTRSNPFFIIFEAHSILERAMIQMMLSLVSLSKAVGGRPGRGAP